MARASPPSARVRGRTRPPDSDRPGQHDQRPVERECFELTGRTAKLQQVWYVSAFAGISRRFAYAPCLSDGSRRGRRSLYYSAEVLLRWQLCDSKSASTD